MNEDMFTFSFDMSCSSVKKMETKSDDQMSSGIDFGLNFRVNIIGRFGSNWSLYPGVWHRLLSFVSIGLYSDCRKINDCTFIWCYEYKNETMSNSSMFMQAVQCAHRSLHVRNQSQHNAIRAECCKRANEWIFHKLKKIPIIKCVRPAPIM